MSEWAVPYWLVDTAFATMLFLLGLTEEGLGALFFALRRPAGPLLEALGVPAGWEPLGAVAVGWPSPDEQPSGSPAGPANPRPKWCTGAPGASVDGRRSVRAEPGRPGGHAARRLVSGPPENPAPKAGHEVPALRPGPGSRQGAQLAGGVAGRSTFLSYFPTVVFGSSSTNTQ